MLGENFVLFIILGVNIEKWLLLFIFFFLFNVVLKWIVLLKGKLLIKSKLFFGFWLCILKFVNLLLDVIFGNLFRESSGFVFFFMVFCRDFLLR